MTPSFLWGNKHHNFISHSAFDSRAIQYLLGMFYVVRQRSVEPKSLNSLVLAHQICLREFARAFIAYGSRRRNLPVDRSHGGPVSIGRTRCRC